MAGGLDHAGVQGQTGLDAGRTRAAGRPTRSRLRARQLKLGRKPTVVGTLTRSVSGTAKLKVRLTGKAKQRLKRAKSVKLTLRAVATDAAGNAASRTAKVTLKR